MNDKKERKRQKMDKNACEKEIIKLQIITNVC